MLDASLTHLFHEFLIVLTAVNFPGAVESHGGCEGELDNSATRKVSYSKSAASFKPHTVLSPYLPKC